jgi:hypothetical protein
MTATWSEPAGSTRNVQGVKEQANGLIHRVRSLASRPLSSPHDIPAGAAIAKRA